MKSVVDIAGLASNRMYSDLKLADKISSLSWAVG